VSYINKMSVLFIAEITKLINLLKNYPLDVIGNTVSFIIAITAIIFGVYKFSNVDNVENLIIYPLLLALIGTPSSSLREDIEIGTFEQVFNSNYTIAEILICRSLISFITSFFPMTIILILVRIFINTNTFLSPFTILLTLLNGISIGMILVGLTMIYRKVGSLLNLVYLLSLIEFVIPSKYISSGRCIFEALIPFSSVILMGMSTNITFTTLFIAIFNTLFWSFLGYILYKSMYNYARKSGKLGRY